MAALSAVTFSLSWWLGLYLLARDPRKPVLVLAAIGLTSFAGVVAMDAVRVVTESDVLGGIEIYLVAVPGIAWFAVLVELSRPSDSWRSRTGEIGLVAGVAAVAFFGAAMAGNVDGPLRTGHWVMFAAISVSTLGAMLNAVLRRSQPGRVAGFVVIATLFFALANAILVIPLGLVPSWLALASTGFDVAVLGLAVAMWDAFDEGQALTQPSEFEYAPHLLGAKCHSRVRRARTTRACRARGSRPSERRAAPRAAARSHLSRGRPYACGPHPHRDPPLRPERCRSGRTH